MGTGTCGVLMVHTMNEIDVASFGYPWRVLHTIRYIYTKYVYRCRLLSSFRICVTQFSFVSDVSSFFFFFFSFAMAYYFLRNLPWFIDTFFFLVRSFFFLFLFFVLCFRCGYCPPGVVSARCCGLRPQVILFSEEESISIERGCTG